MLGQVLHSVEDPSHRLDTTKYTLLQCCARRHRPSVTTTSTRRPLYQGQVPARRRYPTTHLKRPIPFQAPYIVVSGSSLDSTHHLNNQDPVDARCSVPASRPGLDELGIGPHSSQTGNYITQLWSNVFCRSTALAPSSSRRHHHAGPAYAGLPGHYINPGAPGFSKPRVPLSFPNCIISRSPTSSPSKIQFRVLNFINLDCCSNLAYSIPT